MNFQEESIWRWGYNQIALFPVSHIKRLSRNPRAAVE
jgi:hypothetical protein